MQSKVILLTDELAVLAVPGFERGCGESFLFISNLDGIGLSKKSKCLKNVFIDITLLWS